MIRNTDVMAVVVSLFLVAVSGGCARPLGIAAMIPGEITFHDSPVVNRTLLVKPVAKSAETTLLTEWSVDQNEFRVAIQESLSRAGIFPRVSAEEGDLVLSTEILFEECHGDYEVDSTLLVRYQLTEGNSGRRIWSDNILSVYRAPFWVSFWEPSRSKRALSGTARKNLLDLSTKLEPVLRDISNADTSAGPVRR